MSDLKGILKSLIDERLDRIKGVDHFVVTGVNVEAQTLNIKRLNINESYDNVEMLGLGLGNGKGQVKLPNVEDVVVATFIGNSEIPVVLGTVYDTFSTEKDARIDVLKDEYFVNNRTNGSYIHIDQDDNITFKTPDGAKLRLAADGGFKLFNKDNYGIEVDASGNMILRSVDQNSVTTGGIFP